MASQLFSFPKKRQMPPNPVSLAVPLRGRYRQPMRPLDLQIIGQVLAIKWEGGEEDFIPLEFLRRHCPCAGCKGEMDVMGNIYKAPDRPLTPSAFVLTRIVPVGNYAVNLFWGDGHQAGIYSYNYLRRLAATHKQG